MQPVHLERVESLSDDRISDYRNVKDGALRREAGRFMVEGVLNLETLIRRSPFAPRSVFVTPTVALRHAGLLEELGPETSVFVATQGIYDAVAGFNVHRGCLAVCDRAAPPSLGSLLSLPGRRLLVVLEGLTNDENVGSVFRNAMAFGASGVVLCPRCADPLYRKAIRVSMGGTLCVPYARAEAWPVGIEQLREARYTVVALHPGPGSVEIRELAAAAPERLALLLGTEGPGISPEALARVDVRARIEMATGVDSINVATAGAIALHHLSRPGAPEPAS